MPQVAPITAALVGFAALAAANAAAAQSYSVVVPALPPAGTYGGGAGAGGSYGGSSGGVTGFQVVVPALPPAGTYGGGAGAGAGGGAAYQVVVPALPPAGTYGSGGPSPTGPTTGGDAFDIATDGGSSGGASTGGGPAPLTDPFASPELDGGQAQGGGLEGDPGGDVIPVSAPAEALALNADARRMLSDGDAVAALALAEEARDAAPDAPEMWDTLGAVYAALGRADEALAAYRFAIRLDAGSGPRVDAYQQALSNEGYLSGPMSGVYDDATDAALQACLSAGCPALAAD